MEAKTFAKRLLGKVVHDLLPKPVTPLAVLTYHSIGIGAPGSQRADRFREQMQWLHQNRDRFEVSTDVGIAAPCKGRTTVLITFDDGYLDNWEVARPILDEFSLKACFFVTTGFIDGDRGITKDFRNYRNLPHMTWEHVALLAGMGHVIGLHGERHLNFHVLSQAEAIDDAFRAAERLLERTGLRAHMFSYPFGLLEHQRTDLDRVFHDMGLRLAFTSMHSRADADRIAGDNAYRYSIPRLRIDPNDSLNVFVEKLNGYWDFVAPIQRARYSAGRWWRGTGGRALRTK